MYTKGPKHGCINLTLFAFEQILHWTKNNLQQLLLQQFNTIINELFTICNKVNKPKPSSLLLHQPLSQLASFLLATIWNAGTPSDGMCYNKHTLPSLSDQSVITHISHQFTKAIWPYYPRWLYSPEVLYLNKTVGSILVSSEQDWRCSTQ